jgi:hypothetical protein
MANVLFAALGGVLACLVFCAAGFCTAWLLDKTRPRAESLRLRRHLRAGRHPRPRPTYYGHYWLSRLLSWARLPYFEFHFDIFILEIQTELFCEVFDMMETRYILLDFRLFRRYGFAFRLYTPWQR